MSLNIDNLTHSLKVVDKINETSEATSFTLEIPNALREKFKYQPGQFVSLFLEINGESLSRSYSLSSSPDVDSFFQITVKRVPGGKASNFLCDQVQVGQSLKATPPSGHFFKFKEQTKHFVLFGAGSGITPLFSILKWVLKTKSDSFVTLVFGNRSEDQIIYKDQINQWSQEYSGRLQVHHLLSQPTAAWELPTSKCTEGWLKAFYKTLSPDPYEIYLCGPDGFMELVRQSLSQCGVPDDRLHQESFNAASPAGHKPQVELDGRTLIGNAPIELLDSYNVEVTLSGETKSFTVPQNQTILEALIEAGENPPYSCMDGACMACMGKVTEGLVMQDDPGILAQENIEAQECLTCQAKPRSKNVKLNYDIF